MAKGLKRRREIDQNEGSTEPKKAKLKITEKPSKMLHTAKRLETLSLDCIASNLDLIESLVGLPELMGKVIFDHIAKYLNTRESYPSVKIQALLKVFDEAYGEQLLEELTFLQILNDQEMHSRNLIMNECSYFVETFTELKKLDLSNCELGNDCSMLTHISKMTSLEFLNLSGNHLDKQCLMRLTGTIKYYGRGLTNLKVLDLSFNSRIDYTCIDLIARFPSLEALHLSGTTTGDPQFEALSKKMGFSIKKFEGHGAEQRASDFFDFHVHQSKGWASQFLNDYLQKTYAEKHLVKIEEKPQIWSTPRSFYNKKAAQPYQPPKLMEDIKEARFYVILLKNNKLLPSY